MKKYIWNSCGLPLLLLIVFIITSCSNSKQDVNYSTAGSIQIEAQDVHQIDLTECLKEKLVNRLDNLILRVKYIPLETSSECLLDGNCQIEYFTVDTILISSNHTLFLFDGAGRFIRQFGKRGRGPQEYTSLTDLVVDDKERIIYLLNSDLHKILKFSFEGQCISTFTIKDYALNLDKINGDTLIVYIHPISYKPDSINYFLKTYSFDGKQLSQIKSNQVPFKEKPELLMAASVYHLNKDLYIQEPFGELVYKVDNFNKISPYLRFNSGKYQMPKDIAVNLSKRDSFKNKFITNMYFYETSDYVFVRFYFGNKLYSSVYSKGGQRFIFITKSSSRWTTFIHADNGLFFWPKYVADENTIVNIIFPNDLNNKDLSKAQDKFNSTVYSELYEIMKSKKDTDNPILQIITLNPTIN